MYLHHVAKMLLWKPCISYKVLVMLIFMLMMIQHLEAVVVVLNIMVQNGYVNYVMVTQFLLKMIKSLNMGLEHTLAGK